jgi:hypothetical protein
MEGVMRKAVARAVARRANEDEQATVLLWSAALWVAALIFLLATFDVMH